MSDLDAMVKGVLDSLDGAGALADMLAELGREREAVLLRRRWKAWQTKRAYNAYHWRSHYFRGDPSLYPVYEPPSEIFFQLEEKMRLQSDEQFRTYIRERFVGLQPVDVPVWATSRFEAGVAHAVVSTEGEQGWTHTLCGVLGTGYVPSSGVPEGGLLPKRICRQCRTAMPTARVKPTEVPA